MEITKIKTLWPENERFSLERSCVEDEFIFLHIITEMYTLLDGKEVLLPAGTCIFYPPGSHQLIWATSGGLLHDWVHFTTQFGEFAKHFEILPLTPYTPQDSTFVTELLRGAELEFMNRDIYSEEICRAKLTELLARLSRECNGKEKESVPSKLHSAFFEARAKIHMEYNRSWDIDEMAELVHLSPSRFFAIYKSLFGISPKSDLLAVRMEHARSLLENGELSVKEAAETTGYTNVYHFIRSFKTHFGISPGRYKKR